MTRLFRLTLFVWWVGLCFAPLLSGEEIYATAETGAFYVIDTDTLTMTELGVFPPPSNFLGGLSFLPDGELVGLGIGGGSGLWSVDASDGSLTAIGVFGLGFVFEGGLSVDPTSGVLYGCSSGSAAAPNLITIDPATGLATEVGEFAQAPHDFSGLTFDASGDLFAIDRTTNALWRIDKDDPSGPGTFQVGPQFGSGISVGVAGGMTRAANGEIYAYASGSRHLFTLDLGSGLPTIVTQLPATTPMLGGLAIDSSFIEFQRGDANQDGTFDVTDIVVTLSALFDPGTLGLLCEESGDCNDDGVLDISDPVFGLIVLFGGVGTPLPEPANLCGVDPTADPLPCGDPFCP